MDDRAIYTMFKEMDKLDTGNVNTEDFIKFLKLKNKEVNGVEDFVAKNNLKECKTFRPPISPKNL